MKGCGIAVIMLFCAFLASAADSLFIREQQLPILIDRIDNALYELRLSAEAGDVVDEITLQLGDRVNLKDIAAIRLFYGGIEAPSRIGKHFGTTTYLSNHHAGKTRQALASYSVLQDEVTTPLDTHHVKLHSRQVLRKGIHYFWISLQMKPETSLLTTLSSNLIEVSVNGQPQPIHGEGKVDKRRVGIGVRHAGDDGVAAYRIPGLVTTHEGTLLGVYDIRYNNSVDLQEKIDIGISRSTDKGQTWEPMRVAMSFRGMDGLPDSQNGVGDPSILVDERTNTVWIAAAWTQGMGNLRAWTNSRQGMNPDETAQLMLVKSEDDGQTWSEPINITAQVKDPSWYFLLQGPGRGITMRDGTLVFPIQFIDSTRVPNAGIMYSKDRGESWHIHNLARTNTTEAQVAEVEAGVLMLNMRDNRGGSRAVAITKDLGKTWTEHPSSRSSLREPICMASLIKVNASDNITGKDLLLFSNPDTTEGRHHITIKASLDGGLSWPEAYQVLLDEGESWGYSCLTLMDQETIGILYESCVAHLVFQAIPISEFLTLK